MTDKLNDNDKQRIEINNPHGKGAWYEFNAWKQGAEYATLFERQQQTPKENIYNLCERIKELEQLGFDQLETQRQQSQYIKQLEAERSELRNKVIEECIESLKAKGVEESDYNGKIILSTLNSLKTK